MLPAPSYRNSWTAPATPMPLKRTTPGSPSTSPENCWAAQVAPGLISPVKVSTPLHAPVPARPPLATKWIGPVEGVFVSPGEMLKVPLGAAGVPPQAHTARPRLGAARVTATGPRESPTAASATAPQRL